MINASMNLTRFSIAAAVTLLIACGVHAQNANDPNAPAKEPETKPASPATQPDESDEKAALEYVLMKTSKGDILLELNREKAPISVENFLSYVEKEHYDGTIFHRITKAVIFVIQGGGFTEDMTQKPTGSPIKNEGYNGLSNERGSIAMARTSAPDSATAQFYINVKDNTQLDGDAARNFPGYAVFGRVVAGLNVMDSIHSAPTGVKDRIPDVPVEPIVIKSAREITADDAKKMVKDESDKAPTTRPSNAR